MKGKRRDKGKENGEGERRKEKKDRGHWEATYGLTWPRVCATAFRLVTGFNSFLGYYSGGEDYFYHDEGAYDMHRDPTPMCGQNCSTNDFYASQYTDRQKEKERERECVCV